MAVQQVKMANLLNQEVTACERSSRCFLSFAASDLTETYAPISNGCIFVVVFVVNLLKNDLIHSLIFFRFFHCASYGSDSRLCFRLLLMPHTFTILAVVLNKWHKKRSVQSMKDLTVHCTLFAQVQTHLWLIVSRSPSFPSILNENLQRIGFVLIRYFVNNFLHAVKGLICTISENRKILLVDRKCISRSNRDRKEILSTLDTVIMSNK